MSAPHDRDPDEALVEDLVARGLSEDDAWDLARANAGQHDVVQGPLGEPGPDSSAG